ncbi:hypothetical protein ACIGG6_02235 [Vreelandella lionensis]|uniref:Uncharacterized protein n=1 Tax=Vreelandella lionensis TaxID=1144478 RepID=A0ABW8BRC1_9GAMM
MLNREPRIPTTRKAEGEHLDNPARVRFKDSEYLALEQAAEMRHGGVISHAIRECALVGMEVIKLRQDVLLDRLAKGESVQTAQQEMVEALMAHLIENRITEQMMQRLRA